MDLNSKQGDPTLNAESHFPLFVNGEFDFWYANSPWKIALDSRTPNEVKKSIAASIASYMLGTSVDGILRKTLKSVSYPDPDPDRIDFIIRQHIAYASIEINRAIIDFSHDAETHQGLAICEWVLGRFKFSIEIACYAAQRGALFECCSIVRSLMEIIAWASAIAGSAVDELNVDIDSQRQIRHLKVFFPESGKLYGWLSEHAHFSSKAHYKNFRIKDGKVGHLFASSEYKAMSLAAIIVMIDLMIMFLSYHYFDRLKDASSDRVDLKILNSIRIHNRALIDKILDYFPENIDIVQLIAFLPEHNLISIHYNLNLHGKNSNFGC